MPPQTTLLEKSDGLNLLKDLLSRCTEAEYIYSKVTDIDEREVDMPVILLKEPIVDKENYTGKAVTSTWRAIGINPLEMYLFLSFQFEGIGERVFKFESNNPKTAKWLHKVIETGVIMICDKNGDFDIGITNIPIDIPIAQLYLQNLVTAKYSTSVGG